MHRHRLAARQRQADEPQEADQVAAGTTSPPPTVVATKKPAPKKKPKAKGRR